MTQPHERGTVEVDERRDDALVELALAHRALAVGDRARVRFIGSRWTTARRRDVLDGAGFAVLALDGRDALVERLRSLPDWLRPGLRLVTCGLNPSVYAADAGVNFARPGNRFWPAALAAGLVTRDRDPHHAVRVDGVGMTDLVKRATARADELDASEFASGWARVRRSVEWLQPGVLCVLGVTGWRHAVDRRARLGVQDDTIGGVPVYVMPNPSGLNAHATPAALAEHLGAALALARRHGH